MKAVKALEAKHTLFDSVEEMLKPRTLSQLVQKPMADVKVIPLGDNGGVSGSRFSAVETDGGWYFLKHMSPDYDFIMTASDDARCRGVTLWQHGLLDELRPFVEHKIVGCARDGGGRAILMEDLRESLFSDDRPFAMDHFLTFIDALARTHAAFWNDPRLADPALGLMDTATLVNTFSPLYAGRYAHYTTTPAPEWVTGGWQALPDLVPPEVFEHFQRLFHDPQPLVDAVARLPHTLNHGDYRQANLAYDGSTCMAFDWQLSAVSLMTVDLSWFVHQDEVLNTIGIERAIAIYRDRLEIYLQRSFSESQWQEMIDLGFCVDALGRACFPAFFSTVDEWVEGRERWIRKVQSKAQYVVNAARWL
jgi:hypothetical protein